MTNPDRPDRRAYFAEYARTHRATIKAWVTANSERVRAAKRRWAAKNPDYWKQYYLKNLERDREKRRAYYMRLSSEDKARWIERVRQYRKKNHERLIPMWRKHRNAYRARKEGAAGSHTEEQWAETQTLHAGCCLYCGEQRTLVRDHKIPLSRGGSDSISNIAPACNSCNASKGNKTAAEFLAAIGGSRD